MTGKVLDNGSAGALVLILPLAFSFVILYMLWPYLLLIAAVVIAFKVWQNYQWRKWCESINPDFNRLIKENQGYLTPVDLAVKANLTARNAKIFLARKSDEYGTKPKTIPDKGLVYYFPTASALGSIFDDSEPEAAVNSYQLAAKDSSKLSVRGIAQLAKQEQSEVDNSSEAESSIALVNEAESTSTTANLEPEAETDSHRLLRAEPSAQSLAKQDDGALAPQTTEPAVTVGQTIEPSASIDAGQSLIQAELAKRLDLNSSTVGRRKSDPDFAEWSQSKDPEGIAWRYEPDSKLFVADV